MAFAFSKGKLGSQNYKHFSGNSFGIMTCQRVCDGLVVVLLPSLLKVSFVQEAEKLKKEYDAKIAAGAKKRSRKTAEEEIPQGKKLHMPPPLLPRHSLREGEWWGVCV